MTSCSASLPLSSADSPPRPDELEISVFGKGVGEALAIHLGDSEWMAVDSFVDSQTGRPVVLDYLERLGLVPQTCLRYIAVTHWHDDHTSGTSTLLDSAPNARVGISAALNTREVRKQMLGKQSAWPFRAGEVGR